MEPLLFAFIGAALVLGLLHLMTRRASFTAQSPSDYAGTGPHFNLRDHLNGQLLCEGVIYGPTGRVTSRFVADFDAHWDGDKGTMKEHFRYDSGQTQNREWRLTLANDGSVRAEADDVIGVGKGMQEGPAVELRYKLKLPEDSGGHVLDAVDWMYVVDNGTIINRSQFRKFGIKVAELVATMRKKEAA